jgi:glucose/arabinose dehydrogenase
LNFAALILVAADRVHVLAEGLFLPRDGVATGWIGEEERAWGRPADVLELADGSLLASDDRANVLYRIHYRRE